jgi:hypothetical protein
MRLNGRRGAFLLLFGLIYLVMGYALTLELTQPPPHARFLHDNFPWWIRATLWGGCGFVALITAFVRDARFTIVGYTALSLPPAERLASYSLSWLVLDVDIRVAILGAIIYGALLTAILIVASWPEPDPEKIRSILPPDKRAWQRWWR